MDRALCRSVFLHATHESAQLHNCYLLQHTALLMHGIARPCQIIKGAMFLLRIIMDIECLKNCLLLVSIKVEELRVHTAQCTKS